MRTALASPMRLALYSAALGVVLGAVTIGPLDVLVMARAMLTASAVILAAAVVGRRLGLDVVRGRETQDQAAQDDRNDLPERHGAAGADGED